VPGPFEVEHRLILVLSRAEVRIGPQRDAGPDKQPSERSRGSHRGRSGSIAAPVRFCMSGQ
jgi:hypothetical protein